MNFEQFTHKTQEALQHAQESARTRGHQGVTPAHVLLALLSQPEGVLAPLIEKAGLRVHVLSRELEASLEKLPKVAAKRRPPLRHPGSWRRSSRPRGARRRPWPMNT